ncbi:MAG: DEAD/DEAH box helicase, partial [Gemmatimonadetes bacterium]|nr:DEAD/DEAH box helicase [Gemmatimonadota bacterium]
HAVWSDDGIVLTIADGDDPPGVDDLIPDAEELEDRVIGELARSPLFASQFRENAARALLLPRRRPGQRTPLFAQRQRAQKLMSVAMQYPSFPIVMETYRSCLQDVLDVPALREVLRAVESREIRVHEVEGHSASPFARSLVFAYVAEFLYEGDSPAAERRAQALSLDMKLLRELLGEADLRELLDADLIAELEDQLQRRAEKRRARHADELHDVLRQVGELTDEEARERSAEDPLPWLRKLERGRRAARVRIAGRDAWIAVEDVALYRDALGTAPPAGVASAFLEPVENAVEALLRRYARTHGPFTAGEVAARYGLVEGQVRLLLAGSSTSTSTSTSTSNSTPTSTSTFELRAEANAAKERGLLRGEFTPGGTGEEWVDAEVLRQIKRRTIAKLRGEVAPVSRETLARFLPAWHRVAGDDPHESLADAIIQLEGIPLGYRDLVRTILPARVRTFRPEMLDELGAMGWLVWVGHSPLRSDDGRIMLYRRERVDRLLIPPAMDELPEELDDDRHRAILDHLDRRGASFHAEVLAALPDTEPADVLEALWDLVWAGLVTNDTFAALRSLGTARRRGRGASDDATRPVRAPSRAGASRRFRSWRPTGALLRAGTAAGAGGPAGRWSLVRDLVRSPVRPTERAAAWAATLLERHGLVARETAAVEALGGGFSSVYRVLRSMEEAGKVRRGYFVEGLGGAQFAYPGLVDRLRRVRDGEEDGDVVALAATDPANPYGWLLPWPALVHGSGHGPRRASGSAVVLVDGRPTLWVDRSGKRLRTFEDASPDDVARGLPALATLARGRRRGLAVEEVDGEPAIRSALAPAMKEAGFEQDYRSMRIGA